MQYSLDEITLIPARISEVGSRKDVNPFTEEGKLPIFVSPMTCILDGNNFTKFYDSKVIPIYPIRYTDTFEKRVELATKYWVAFSVEEVCRHFLGDLDPSLYPYNILIDCAQGHMKKLYDIVPQLKTKFPTLRVMVGNIANPEAYGECCRAGVDYVRIGIGGGFGCTTTSQTGFHTSIPYMLLPIANYKRIFAGKFLTKVIVDGGVNSVDKIIKSLALGADYVMLGNLFAQCKEACGETREINCEKEYVTNPYNNIVAASVATENYSYKEKPGTGTLQRHYYGQSSTQGQKDRFGEVKGNPEGTDKWINVEYSLTEFTDKIEAVLRSAMSYAGAFTLDDFIGKVQYDTQSTAEYYGLNHVTVM